MKKFLLSAIAMLALSASSFAAESEYYVTNKAEMVAALKASSSMQDGDVTTIILCNKKDAEGKEAEVADNSLVVNTGNIAQKEEDANLPLTGKLVIKSNQKDLDNLPQLQTAFDYREFTTKSTSKLSIFFENVSIQFRSGVSATSGQVLYWEKMDMDKMQLDSIVVRNCDISNIPRTFFRTAPNAVTEETTLTPSKINYFEISGCKAHNMAIANGNNWAFIVFGSMPVEVKMFNNMFYDMPYTKGIISMAYVQNDGTAPKIYFYNNTVMMAKAQYTVDPDLKNNGCCIVNAGNFLDASTEYYFYNNLILTPKMGAIAVPTDVPDFAYVAGGTDLLNASDVVEEVKTPLGYMTASNNYLDESFKALDRGAGDNDLVEHTLQDEGMVFDWNAFFKPATSNFLVEKTNAFYTAGAAEMPLNLDGTVTVPIDKCVGASLMYVDAFPQEAKVNVSVAGSDFVDVTLSPQKDIYMVGDEITITLNDHNSYYRTFNTFKGWSDGSMENPRTVTITDIEGINLTANYEYGDSIVAAFDFSKVNGKDAAEYVADLGQQMGTAKLTCMAADTTGIAGAIQTAALPYVEGKFQTRAAKFGEDPTEQQMAIVSRRTAKEARDFNRNYAVLQFSTKAMKAVKINAFVGTDNNASLNQFAYWSLDNVTYTKIEDATVQLENGKWSNVNFTLPAEAEGQDVVYVKFQGEVTGGDDATNCAYTPQTTAFDPSNFHGYDVFEYMGNILITAQGFDFTPLNDAITNANAAIATFKSDEAKQMVTDAINAATPVLTTATSQEEIDAAAKTLNAAVADAKKADLVFAMKALEVEDGTTVKFTTLDNAKAFYAEGWLTTADGSEPANTISKKSTIDPETDATIKAASYSGITVKNNGPKQFYVKVKYATNAKFYVTTDKNGERGMDVSIYGTSEKKSTGLIAGSTGAVVEFSDLDATKEYVFFLEANGDMDLYAIKFVGDNTGVSTVEADAQANGGVKKYIKNGKLVIEKNGAEYNAAGAQQK